MRRGCKLAAMIVAGALVAACSGGGGGRGTPDGATGASSSASAATGTTSAPKTSVRVVATGDMIAHDAILQEGKKPDGSWDFSPMLAGMKPYFERADVRFCNEATPAAGPGFTIKGYPDFNAPFEWSAAMEGAGCNVINLGTNHTNDRGQAGIDSFRGWWDGRPVLAVAGANRSPEEQQQIAYFSAGGLSFALLSYVTYDNTTPTAYGVNPYAKATAAAQIAEARQRADIVIVSMRWGTEDSPALNRAQQQQAQELADAGADIVLGHGPHVLQPVERLTGAGGRTTIVWYSLGNFLNAQLPVQALIGGFAVMDVDIATKQVTDVAFLPTYSSYQWTAQQAAAGDLLSRRGFTMLALDKATDEQMAANQLSTTVAAEQERVRQVLNRDSEVRLLTSEQYLAP